jgi:hypothetical protein
MRTTYKNGDWVACCDRCREKMYASMLKRDGHLPNLMVCARCWDRKHPNDTPTKLPVDEHKPLPFTRPLGTIVETDLFLTEDDY